VKRLLQRSLHCRCGNQRILAHGLCPTCYTLRRQDETCFGGMREAVLSGTATVAESAVRREDGSDQSLSIIAFLEDPCCRS